MPLYDYHCSACETQFEQYQKMADNKVPEGQPCPCCNSVGTVQQSVNAINISANVKTNPVVPGDFKDLLKSIHKGAGKYSKIET